MANSNGICAPIAVTLRINDPVRENEMKQWRIVLKGCLSSLLLVPVLALSQPRDPDTCLQGFVWREAYPGDHVCVEPEARAQAAADNRQSEARKAPGGGAYGPDTCKPGFVWREARPQDHVCVTPEVRQQTADDNRQAQARRLPEIAYKNGVPAGPNHKFEKMESLPKPAPAPPSETRMYKKSAPSELPEFPWPPPPFSARLKIDRELLVKGQTAPTHGSVATRLENALAANKYRQISYYAVPDGFAMVTQIERIKPDATSEIRQRWSTQIEKPVPFSLDAYIKALLGKDGDLFRVIVFAFTPLPITTGKPVDPREAMQWAGKGADSLPEALAAKPYDKNMKCTALIYEFRISSQGPGLHSPSDNDGQEHLRAAGILDQLERP
jgi:hypothetical protein